MAESRAPSRMSRIRNSFKSFRSRARADSSDRGSSNRSRTDSSDDEISMLKQVEERFTADKSGGVDESSVSLGFDESMALNDSEFDTEEYTMPLRKEFDKEAPPVPKRKSSLIRQYQSSQDLRSTHELRSILRESSSQNPDLTGKAKTDKRLSFALSPTFISDSRLPVRRKSWNDSMGECSMHSLDGDEIFGGGNDEPAEKKGESSLVLEGSMTAVAAHRRSSLTEFKSKSSLGFDERFVGLHESDLGSIGHASWTSL